MAFRSLSLHLVALVSSFVCSAVAQDVHATKGATARVNGIELYYESIGQGEPLVLLHGFFSTGKRSWSPFIDHFAKRFQVIVPDLRGHGRSTNPTGEFTHSQSARDIIALMDELKIAKFNAMGISSGGMTLLHVATSNPDRIQSLVLIGATHYFGDEARKYCGAVTDDGDSLNLGDFIQDTEMKKFHVHGDKQIRDLRRQFRAFASSYDDMNFTSPYLSTIKARTLIIHGDRDEFFPIQIPVEIYKSIPDSALWIIPNGGHVPIYDESMPFVERTTSFIAGDRARR